MENTVEGNVLIDLFMHPNYTRKGDWIWWNDEQGSRNHIDAVHYENNWNRLMPVVEKITAIIPHNNTKAFEIGCKMCDSLTKVNITDTWQAVVQFIQWYNLQTKTP